MSRPSPTQLTEVRDVLAEIIDGMPDPTGAWAAQQSAAYLQGAVAGLTAALGTSSDRRKP